MEATLSQLMTLFPEVDARILRATAFEHPTSIDDAASYILGEVLPISKRESSRACQEPSPSSSIEKKKESPLAEKAAPSSPAPAERADVPLRRRSAARYWGYGVASRDRGLGAGREAGPNCVGGSNSVATSANVAAQTDSKPTIMVETIASQTNATAEPPKACAATSTEPTSVTAVGTATEAGLGLADSAQQTDKQAGSADTAQQTDQQATGADSTQEADKLAALTHSAQQTDKQVGVAVGTAKEAVFVSSTGTSMSEEVEVVENETEKEPQNAAVPEGHEEREADAEQDMGAQQLDSNSLEGLQALVQASNESKEELAKEITAYLALCSEAEAAEAAAARRKEEVTLAGKEQLEEAEKLLKELPKAQAAVEQRAGNVHGEKTMLVTEARELQARLKAVAAERTAIQTSLKELCGQLRERIEAAKKAEEKAMQEQEAARAAAQERLDDATAKFAEVEREIQELDTEEEKCNKLREFLNAQDRAVDAMQVEVAVLQEDLERLRQQGTAPPLSLLRSANGSSCFTLTPVNPGLDQEPGFAVWRNSLGSSFRLRLSSSDISSHSTADVSKFVSEKPAEVTESSPVASQYTASYTSAAYASAMADHSQVFPPPPPVQTLSDTDAVEDEPLSPINTRLTHVNEFELNRMLASQHVAFRGGSRNRAPVQIKHPLDEEAGWHFLDRDGQGSSRGSSFSSGK